MYFDFLLTVFSGTSSSTFSSVFGGMYSDICSDIFGHSIWHLLFVFYLAVVSGMYSDICLAYILAFDLAFTLTSSLAFYLAPTLVLLWHLYLAPISGTYCDSLSVIVSGFLTFYDMNPSGRCSDILSCMYSGPCVPSLIWCSRYCSNRALELPYMASGPHGGCGELRCEFQSDHEISHGMIIWLVV